MNARNKNRHQKKHTKLIIDKLKMIFIIALGVGWKQLSPGEKDRIWLMITPTKIIRSKRG